LFRAFLKDFVLVGEEKRLKGQGVRVTGGIAFWKGFSYLADDTVY